MSIESATLQSTEEALRELQTAFDLYRQGSNPKGVTGARKREWADLIAMILLDATYPLESFFPHLSVLPPALSATGAITAWSSMTLERRAAYLRWVDTLDSDRAGSQKALLIPGLLDQSPETSVDLLCNTSLNKDLRDRLASSLLIPSSDKVSCLLTSDIPQYKVPELLNRLLELTESPKVTAEAKWHTVRLALNTMVAQNLHSDSRGASLLHLIANQIPSLPPAIKQEMKTVLTELDARLVDRFFPGKALPAEPPPVPVPVPERVPEEAPKLSDWLTKLQQQVTILQELQEHIRSLEEQQAYLDNELRKSRSEKDAACTAAAENLAAYRGAEEKIRTLEERLREADTSAQLAREQSDSLRRSMTAVVEKEKTLHQELTQQGAKFLKERNELFQRIEANAERRLEEYCNGLASSFARLFHGVPERRSAVSTETGQVLLTRLYQVIDFLESKGIRVLSGEGDRR